MLSYLKQSTASQTRIVGPFVDDTDFKTLETALSIANTDVKLSKNGGTSANKNSGGGTHIVNGDYAFTFDATDTDTVGELSISISVSGALVCKAKFVVLEEAVYDGLFASGADGKLPATLATADVTGNLPADVIAVSGDTSAADNLELDYDGTGFAKDNSTIGTCTTNTDMVQEAPTAAAVRAEMDSNSTQLAAIVGDTNELQTDWANGGRLDLILDARSSQSSVDTIDGIVDAILVDTNELQTDDVPGLIAALNDLSAAAVNAEVDSALSDIHLDHLFATAYDATSKPGAADALLNEMVEDDSGVTRYTVNALENGPSGSGASAAAIADAVWDEAQADHTTAGTFGLYLDDEVSNAGGSGLTAGAVADAVWDELASGHTTVGSFGYYLDDRVSQVGGGTPESIAGEVWDKAATSHLTVGSFGALFQASAVYTNPATNEISIRRNDAYNGTANAAITWTVAKDFTSGWTGTLTVRHRNTGASLLSTSITVTDSATLTASLDSSDTGFAALVADTEFGHHPYDVEMNHTSSSSKQTVVVGVCNVTKDYTT